MKIRGEISLPGDKSISHRAALFSAIRPAESVFENFSGNEDCRSTLSCLRQLGIEHKIVGSTLYLYGKKLSQWQQPGRPLYAGNSGTTTRLLAGLLVHLPFTSTITGDASLSQRPMGRIIDPLTAMGGRITATEGHLPMTFHPTGSLRGIRYPLPVASAQIKSAVLLAGLFADGFTEVIETKISRDHTERMLGLSVREEEGQRIVSVPGGYEVPDVSMTIPGDISSAAFFIAAALTLPDSDLTLKNVSLNPTRTAYLEILKKMGASLEIEETQARPEPMGNIRVKSSDLQNVEIPAEMIPNLIDEIPILAVIGTRAVGHFAISHARELRVKESDRIKVMVENLRRTGLHVDEFDDGFAFCGPHHPGNAAISTHGDHRIAMAFTIANMICGGNLEIDDPSCAAVSFPAFYTTLEKITR